jgi:hypothetical protein
VRTAALLAFAVLALACSGEGSSSGGGGRDRQVRDGGPAKRATSHAEHDAGAASASADGGASAGARAWTGTLRGETQVPDGGLPDGGAAWRGQATVRLDVRGEEVGGRVEAAGLQLEVHGNVSGSVLRAWLRSPDGQPRTEGVLLGDVAGDRLTGTWRTSGPGGAEVRAGTFEAHR